MTLANTAQARGWQSRSAFQIPACDERLLSFLAVSNSLAAAFEYSKTGKELQLVSHLTRNKPTRGGTGYVSYPPQKSRPFLTHRQFFVSSRDGKPSPGLDHDAENSQRTRSFLFLVLGALAARRVGHRKILLLAENGQMAIHLPLTQGRIGAFSTHTAPSGCIGQDAGILPSGCLTASDRHRIVSLKPKVVKVLWTGLRQSIPSQQVAEEHEAPSETTHCGHMRTMIIRRIAMSVTGKIYTLCTRSFVDNFHLSSRR